MSEWNFGDAIAEEASEQLRERVREAEAERDRAIERASWMGAELSQQCADRAKAEGERDAALAKLAKQTDWARESESERDAMQVELLRQGRVIRQLDEQLGSAPALNAKHLAQDRKRDEALKRIGIDSLAYVYETFPVRMGECLWCRRPPGEHAGWCPTFVAREVLKEES